MERVTLIVFRLIAPGRDGRVRETGGGVVFMPDPRPESWQPLVADLVARHFHHPLGPCVEVGYATVDRQLLERHCQRHGELFWQGGDA